MRRLSSVRLTVLLAVLLSVLACNLPLFGQGGAGGDNRRPTRCPTTLDQDILDRLTVSMEQTVQMQPGTSRTFELGTVECCYYFEPAETCVTWSVEPTEGASIDAATGQLTVGADVPNGSVFRVSADVENGRRVVTTEVYVYRPDDNPLVATWHELSQTDCDTGEQVEPEEPIRELRFKADGSFTVTWMPFEVYHDYWGTYVYDLQQGSLDLTVSGGNYVPEDIDGSGTFRVDEQGRLVLDDLWLGSPYEGTGTARCGHIFE